MNITVNEFLNYCTNQHIKALVLKCLKRGDNLKVFTNDSDNAFGKYVVSHGAYTVLKY